MPIIKLIHPTLGLCTQQVVTPKCTVDKIIEQWKKKYGRMYLQCETKIEGKVKSKNKAVQDIRTGEIYESVNHAANALKINLSTVNSECYRTRPATRKEYYLKWA